MKLEDRLSEIYIAAFREYKHKGNLKVRKKKWQSYSQGLRNRIEYGNNGKSLANIFPDIKKEYASFLFLSQGEIGFRKRILNDIVRSLAYKEIGYLRKGYTPEEIEEFLKYLSAHHSFAIKAQSIEEKFTAAQSVRIEKQIVELVQTDPTVEFSQARKIKRHFHLHLGPTNSGKTYESIQRLKDAEHGVYLGPLRLLALEIYDTLTEAGVPSQMITGEEHIYTEGARVSSQTVETLDITEKYDIAVIDECQMINDEIRGHAWSKAVLGIVAKEIYLCASENVEELLVGIINSCNDTYDITYHKRKTELIVEDKELALDPEDIAKQVQKGDCLITFSKRTVLDLAARLEISGIKASVIYGKLPPETRKREVGKFTSGETEVVVATDAIGMGVNLPIRRIVLTSNMKYNGHEIRKISPADVMQIAGRAGRYGIYDKGYVTSSIKGYNKELKEILSSRLKPVSSARLGFPRVLLSLNESLDAIITTWQGIEAKPPYKKIATEEMIFLYNTLRTYSRDFAQVPDGDDKETLFGMISVPLDIGNNEVVKQWVTYCKTYAADTKLSFPRLPYMQKGKDLEAYETYYKLLDLYHLFSNHMGKEMDEERLLEEKEWTEEQIERIISGDKNRFVRKCLYCGVELPLESRHRMCDDCLEIRKYSFSASRVQH